MENLYWIGFLGAAAAILFAWLQSRRVLAFSEGSDAMKKIASAIRSGANAYLSHQYATVAKVFVVVFILLLVMAFGTGGAMLSKFTPFAFLTGGTRACGWRSPPARSWASPWSDWGCWTSPSGL